MNVFIPYSDPFEVAQCLDKRRLNKQVIECGWLLRMTPESRGAKHPAYIMWKDHKEWLECYKQTLHAYQHGYLENARHWADKANEIKPEFLKCKQLIINCRKRLYTKNNQFYKQFERYGETDINLYVESKVIKGELKYFVLHVRDGVRLGYKHIEDM